MSMFTNYSTDCVTNIEAVGKAALFDVKQITAIGECAYNFDTISSNTAIGKDALLNPGIVLDTPYLDTPSGQVYLP